jgi:hypothetical protein
MPYIQLPACLPGIILAGVNCRMGLRLLTILVGLAALIPGLANAQDPTGAIEGAITDSSAAAIRSARVVAVNLDTGFTKERESGPDGFYRLLLLPVGRYRVTVSARNSRVTFASSSRSTWGRLPA